MDIRKEFLEYFKSKGHDIVSTMPLVPNDSTLMFTNAGMVQFKDIFTGNIPTPTNPKATSCQLCLRAGGKHNDLENVGYTARHHTLFEMLGNFSFGDYFKEDAINYAWEFITINLQLPIEKLWVTVHDNDEEAYNIWKKIVGEDKIVKFGDKDNFWSMGDTGACGYCSEIFYDQGAEHFDGVEDKMGGEGDRFLEIWNLVFMQYDRQKDGTLSPLPKPSIDTGMGLERVIAIKEGVLNNFDSSTFKPMVQKIEMLCNKKATKENISSYRVIADHVRAVSFMLCDGILFDKEGRGYVLRRILRRAVRHGYLLGFRKPYMGNVVDTLVETMYQHYSFLKDKQEYIKEQIKLEEDRFFKTIEKGMNLFNEQLVQTKDKFSGEIAFKLYDTYGFPLDLTEDMLREKNIEVDKNIFNSCMDEQKAKAKLAWKGSGDIAKDGDFKAILETIGKNEFVGYETTKCQSKIIALLDDNFKQVKSLENSGWMMLDKTPFYATSGGQIGDIGYINTNDINCKVLQTSQYFTLNLSQVDIQKGTLKIGDMVDAVVEDRQEIQKHHSATHLLQSALKKVLGDTVSQAGSLNDSTRLRFDFTYAKAMSKEQLDEVENIVNDMILNNLDVNIQELDIQEARKKGAIAMFGEKYGDVVRVVDFESASVEFCGGTHVKNTAQIGSFYITSEKGVSAGVRRIEAVCGKSAYLLSKSNSKNMQNIENSVKSKDIISSINKLKEQIKTLKIEVQTAQNSTVSVLDEENINGVKVVVDILNNGDLKAKVDDIKNANEKVAIFLLQAKDDKVMMVSGIKGESLKAGDWIKNIAPIVKGGGGGRADFAQAGGKDITKIQDAKEQALKYAKENLK